MELAAASFELKVQTRATLGFLSQSTVHGLTFAQSLRKYCSHQCCQLSSPLLFRMDVAFSGVHFGPVADAP